MRLNRRHLKPLNPNDWIDEQRQTPPTREDNVFRRILDTAEAERRYRFGIGPKPDTRRPAG
jgi:hypothetical protein